METFNRNAKRLGLCDTFSQRWANCKSKKQLFDLACDINSLPYLCESICAGWGLTLDYISNEFPQFINGRYTHIDANQYKSSIYCQPEVEAITIKDTATLVAGFSGRIEIPEGHVCEIYLCKSNATIVGKGHAVGYLYNSTINNADSAPIIVKANLSY